MIADQPLQGSGGDEPFYSLRSLVRVGGWPSLGLRALHCRLPLWAVSGPFFDYSDTWQLVINTATTVLTFLMVLVLQHSQNRDAVAIQAKLDELIKHTKEARDDLIQAELLSQEEIALLREERRERTKSAA